MLALFAVFEHLTNVRRLLNRFPFLHLSLTQHPVKKAEETVPLVHTDFDQEHDILLGPIVANLRQNSEKHEEFQEDEYFARELDACLLEIREIENDLYRLKQRQCTFYEHYLDFIDEKDRLIEKFIEYHDQYILSRPNNADLSPESERLRRQSIRYEFTIPVSNRFELLKGYP